MVSAVVQTLVGNDAVVLIICELEYFCALGLETPFRAPAMGVWGTIEEMETFGSFIPLGMQYPGTDPTNQTNRLCCFGSRCEQNLGSQQETKNHPFAQTPTWTIAFVFGMRGDVGDKITHAKFLLLIDSGVSEF